MSNPGENNSNRRVVKRTIAVGLFVSKDRKFLLGRKDPNGGGVYADCWHLPGGGVDEDAHETLLDALDREMLEEVGLEISSGSVQLIDASGRGGAEKTLDSGEKVWCDMLFNVYRIDLPEAAANIEVNPGDDIKETIWVDPASLKDIKLTPPSVELFTKLGYLQQSNESS